MNVVIVDDTEINVNLMRHLVGRIAGCTPVCFTVSAEGLAWCEENEPDFVIVDYMMPEPDGLEFIRRFRQFAGKADLPILMITANDQKEIRYQALEAGATDFLTKPIDKHEFLARSRNMLALSSSRKQLADRAAWLADAVKKATESILLREQEAVFHLSKAAEYRDPETGSHIQRMSRYSQHIAERLGLDTAQQDLILKAASLHDIGKVGIPDLILLKPDRLDEDEFALMKKHTRIGYEILRHSTSQVLLTGAEIALTHHEKVDGSGYPRGLKGEEIPLLGRIVAVADVFDALTTERPYKQPWPVEQAADFIRTAAGQHFDPECVRAFLDNWQNVLDIRASFREQKKEGRGLD